MQTDQHRVQAQQNITTPAGTGKVFTRKRDTPPSQNAIWFEQHAVIPAGKRWFVIWLKILEPSGGDPTPALAHMLEGFQLR